MFESINILRKKDDAYFVEMLNLIRGGKHSEEDLLSLKTRTVVPESDSYQAIKNELHLFPSNAAVDAFNQNMCTETTGEKVEVKCIDVVLEEDRQDCQRKTPC